MESFIDKVWKISHSRRRHYSFCHEGPQPKAHLSLHGWHDLCLVSNKYFGQWQTSDIKQDQCLHHGLDRKTALVPRRHAQTRGFFKYLQLWLHWAIVGTSKYNKSVNLNDGKHSAHQFCSTWFTILRLTKKYTVTIRNLYAFWHTEYFQIVTMILLGVGNHFNVKDNLHQCLRSLIKLWNKQQLRYNQSYEPPTPHHRNKDLSLSLSLSLSLTHTHTHTHTHTRARARASFLFHLFKYDNQIQ